MSTQDTRRQENDTPDSRPGFAIFGIQVSGRWAPAAEAILAVLLVGLFVATLAATREYFTFGTETDFISSFRIEAQRLLNGEPLTLLFHPAFYSMILALVQAVADDWFLSGLVISFLSALLVVASSFIFFRTITGNYAAWGAVMALLASSTFLVYSSSATSDIFFLALYWSAILSVHHASKTRANWNWVIPGFVVSLAILSRSNGIVLLALLALPWLIEQASEARARRMLWALVGVAIPLCGWIVFANATDSPLWTSKTYTNVALTYFAPGSDRISGEGRLLVEEQFSSLLDVITHDPVLLAKTYVRDLWFVTNEVLGAENLLAFPVRFFAAIGLLVLALTNRSRIVFYVLLLTVAHVLLINLKLFEPRYYLFLVPILGAGIGVMIEHGRGVWGGTTLSRLWLPVFAACFLFAAPLAGVKAFRMVHSADAELSESIAAIRAVTPEGATVMSRKDHVNFYTGRKRISIPNVRSMAELEAFMQRSAPKGPTYIYVGTLEKRFRPPLAILSESGDVPLWLQLVANSSDSKTWSLYLYTRQHHPETD